MDLAFGILVAVIILGLVFDYFNGFHDTANAIATVVATRVLSPMKAVLMAAILNFVGALSGTAVATTVGKGIIEPGRRDPAARHLGAAVGHRLEPPDLVLRHPSSSSHALVFSIVGAASRPAALGAGLGRHREGAAGPGHLAGARAAGRLPDR
jgi:PiT family inorganic phosphate transporter